MDVEFVLVQHFKDNVRFEKFFPDVDMVCCGMMSSPIIGIICFARAPVEFELLLVFPVAQPVEPHVHSLGVFRLYFSIYYCIGHGIVSLVGGGMLFVSHFIKN